MESHARRVRVLGMHLRRIYQEAFVEVNPEILGDFLILHDQAKLNHSQNFIKNYHLPMDSPLLDELYGLYGVIVSSANADEFRARNMALIARINEVDRGVALHFFRLRGLATEDSFSPLAQRYLKIEKIADAVDRGMNPVTAEEFGRPMLAASQFLPDAESKDMATKLEQVYGLLTREMSYDKFKAARDRGFGAPATVMSRVNKVHCIDHFREIQERSLR